MGTQNTSCDVKLPVVTFEGVDPAFIAKMKRFARKKHKKFPNMKPERLMASVAKHFNIILTNDVADSTPNPIGRTPGDLGK